MGRCYSVPDFKITEGLELRDALFEDGLDDPQPIVVQIGSVGRRHIAKGIETECGLGPIDRGATPNGERKRLQQSPSANCHETPLPGRLAAVFIGASGPTLNRPLLTYSQFEPVCQFGKTLRGRFVC
jgi:hypothetical protein